MTAAAGAPAAGRARRPTRRRPARARPDPEAAAQAIAHAGHEIENPDQRVRLYIWQVPVRVTHWVTAACIVILSLTGGYIADPFLIPPGGSVMSDGPPRSTS